MQHTESLPIDLEAPSPDEECIRGSEVVRRNSVNVASVYRASCPELSQRHDGWSTTSSSPDAVIPQEGSSTLRRNSLNVASFMRSKSDLQEVPSRMSFSPWSQRPRQSLTVDLTTIRHLIQFHQAEDDSASEAMLSQSPQEPREVQFTIPEEYELTDDEDFTYHRRQPKPVTFGAYYDTHNDEMIPELRRVESKTEVVGAQRLQKLINNAPPVVRMVATNLACILTHAVMKAHPGLDFQVMTMILVTLCGSTLPHLITAVACGVYAGSVTANTLPSYPWVILLAFFTSIVWQVVSTFKLMLGFSGRLGASAFMGMNFTAVIAFAASPSVDYDRYGNLDQLWDDTTWEEALVTIAACVFLASSASYFRLIATVPVNPVLVPSAWALFCMFLMSLADYEHNPSIFGGFAVGAYVAMAAESRLPNVGYFATVGLIAGFWIIFLKPFFLGFGGKSGFTAMVGYSSFLTVRTLLRKLTTKKQKESKDDDSSTNSEEVYSA
jgi:hypothetical protein